MPRPQPHKPTDIRRFGWSDLFTAASLTVSDLLFPPRGGMPNGLD